VASYQQLTFEPGYAGPARFTHDGSTVVYSAAWNGGPKQLYSQHSNSAQATPLHIDADVMGIADNGDMAVILHRHYLATWVQRGTLARMPLDGGAPRPILEDVYEADISRDGKDFAVVRLQGGKQRLEYPIGKVLYETPGWISDVRISPDGERVAFIDHPFVPDDQGAVAVVDRRGDHKRLTPVYPSGRSLCWAPGGKEVWYTASLLSDDSGLYAVTLTGKNRVVVRAPTELVLQDISATGRVLLESVRFQVEIGMKHAGDTGARSFGIASDLGSLSPDGQWLVYNRFEGSDYEAYVRKTDGTAAVKIGEGYGHGITADGSLIGAGRLSDPHKLYLYPTGAAEQRVIDLGDLSAGFGTYENDITFSRDSHSMLFSAFNPEGEQREYLLDMLDGKLRPVTPPGTRTGKLSPDGSRVAALDINTQKYVLIDVASGKARDIPAIENDEEVMNWNSDGSSVVVWNQELPARITLVNVETGKRQLVQTVEPLTMLGSMYARMVSSADGKTAAYRHRRGLYAIYIADGLQ
jgi:dipeptidyl aminopeptidase/acylaminoacyl peptidase